MLEIRPNCENCDKDISPNSTEAMICTFECTFCSDCVENILENVCPNCGGGFERRPVRPKEHLIKYPASSERIIKPIDVVKFRELLARKSNVEASDR